MSQQPDLHKLQSDFIGGAWGLSTAIDLHSCNPEIIRSDRQIRDFVVELCSLLNVQRYGECIVVHFGKDEKASGYSMVQLIEASLISGHFVDSTNNAHIDIFSCEYYDPQKAATFCREYFQAASSEVHYRLRN